MAAVTGDGTVHLVVYALRRSMAVASVPNPPLTPFETYPGVAPLRAQILAGAAAPQVALLRRTGAVDQRRGPPLRAALRVSVGRFAGRLCGPCVLSAGRIAGPEFESATFGL